MKKSKREKIAIRRNNVRKDQETYRHRKKTKGWELLQDHYQRNEIISLPETKVVEARGEQNKLL